MVLYHFSNFFRSTIFLMRFTFPNYRNFFPLTYFDTSFHLTLQFSQGFILLQLHSLLFTFRIYPFFLPFLFFIFLLVGVRHSSLAMSLLWCCRTSLRFFSFQHSYFISCNHSSFPWLLPALSILPCPNFPSADPYRLSQISIPDLSFHLSFSSFALGVRQAACVSFLLFQTCFLSFTRTSRRPNSIHRLVAFQLSLIHPIANPTSLCVPLKNQQIPGFLSLSHACLQSPVSNSAFWTTFLFPVINYLSPLTFPNLHFSRSPHRHFCSSRRHFADHSTVINISSYINIQRSF